MSNHPLETPFGAANGAANGHWIAPGDDGEIGYECALPFLLSDPWPAAGAASTASALPGE